MRVAIATSFPQDPARPHGGVEAVSVTLVQALASLDDLDVHVVTTDRTCNSPTISTWRGAAIHRLPWAGRNVLTHSVVTGRRRVRAYVSRLGPDVIHAHDIYGLMVKGLPIPRVFTIHGFIHADTRFARKKLWRTRSRLWRYVELRGWADQQHIISISPYVRERLNGTATGVIHDIDNPIAEAFFDVPRHERKGTIFCAALICPRKNTLTLVEAFARLVADGVDAELRLAGPVSDRNYGRRLQERIETLGVGDRVVLLGGIGASQVREELSAASVFVLPSFEEGSPMGIEEAMAARVPVVASNRCGMPYMIRDGETGYLIDPHDPGDIAWRLKQLLEDDDRRTDMGEKARRIALDRFHPATVAKRTREVYVRAVRHAKRGNGRG